MPHHSAVDPVTGDVVPLNIVHANFSHVIAYLVLAIWPAFLGLPLLLAVIILSKKVKRHPTFFNLCMTFIIKGFACGLLLFANKVTGPEPDQILCLLQASMIYGLPLACAMAIFMLVLQMLLTVRAAHYALPLNEDSEKSRLRTWTMLCLPWVAYLAIVLATAVVGAMNPRRVSRNRRVFYCSVDHLPLTNTITVICGLVMFGAMVAQGWALVLLAKHRKVVKLQGHSIHKITGFSFIIRVLAFLLVVLTGMCVSLISITSPPSPAPDLVHVTGGTLLILIFGTQRDIFQALCFWKKSPPVLVEPDFKVVDLRSAFETPRDPVEFKPESHGKHTWF